MKIVFKYLLWGACLFFLCCRENTPPPTTVSKDLLRQQIDSLAHDFLSSGQVMGFSIAVLQGEDTLYNGAYGYVDTLRAQKTQSRHLFNLASISKLVGATIVMKLVEEGTLSLDQTLNELLPDFPNTEQAKKIRLRHLISMTSGLKEYATALDSVYINTGIPPYRQDLFDFFAAHELDFEPGTFYRYSNSGFLLMAMIVERVSGEAYQALLERIINTPSGLNIGLIADSQYDPDISQLFELQGDTIVHRPFWTWLKGDGGMTASAIDLAHFPRKLMSGAIISNASLQRMIAPTDLSEGLVSDYGLGVKNGSFEGEKMWGHSGADKTYWSMMYYFPERDMSIVTFVNTNNTPADSKALFVKVALAVLQKKMPDYTRNASLENDKADYTGAYHRPGDSPERTINIFVDEQDGYLYYSYAGNTRREKMYPLGKDEFWIQKWPTDRVIFVKDKEGKVIALKEYFTGYFSQLRKKIN